MITIGSAHRLQRLHRLQTLTIPRQWSSLFMSGKLKTLIRRTISSLAVSDPDWGDLFYWVLFAALS